MIRFLWKPSDPVAAFQCTLYAAEPVQDRDYLVTLKVNEGGPAQSALEVATWRWTGPQAAHWVYCPKSVHGLAVLPVWQMAAMATSIELRIKEWNAKVDPSVQDFPTAVFMPIDSSGASYQPAVIVQGDEVR